MSLQPNSALPPELSTLFDRVAAGGRDDIEVGVLSDVPKTLETSLRSTWMWLPDDARRFLVRLMIDQADMNVGLNFSRVLKIAMSDPDEDVRALAIHGLWEDESTLLLDQLLQLLDREAADAVRETVAVALGRFSYRAAVDELDSEQAQRLRDALMEIVHSTEPAAIRRRALESVAYFPDDPDVEESILDAYESGEHDFRVSAILAMGRNLSERWIDPIIEDLDDFDPDVRLEAARSAGEYGDDRAIDGLLDLLNDEEPDVQVAALGALGQIGGRIAVRALREATHASDSVISEAARDALAQALLADDPLRLEP